MPYTDPDLSDILTNEQTMNTRLTTYRNKLKAILDSDGISYDENLGINGLIRLLQLPIPTTIELLPETIVSTFCQLDPEIEDFFLIVNGTESIALPC